RPAHLLSFPTRRSSDLLGGIAVLTLALGFTGIVVTHKMVGPAYKIRMMLAKVADGHLKVDGSLRKGDELQDVFIAFNQMVNNLRSEEHTSELQSRENLV